MAADHELPPRKLWPLWCAELVGTALLVAVGGSLVILDFGTGSPVAALVPSADARRAITGFLFGTTGALIAISPVGRISGAHINPVVTLAFWLKGRMTTRLALEYVGAQLVGAVVGATALRAWGAMGASVAFAATVPGPDGVWAAALGETAATFCLVAGLFLFLGHARLRSWTPALFPALYAILVWIEAPLSGASTNPARSLGPGLVAGVTNGWWVYWVGPVAGTLLGVAIATAPWARSFELRVAKVFHFEHDRYGVFRHASGAPRRRAGEGSGRSRKHRREAAVDEARPDPHPDHGPDREQGEGLHGPLRRRVSPDARPDREPHGDPRAQDP